MKKLALALVCLISVAFFASCTPEGQPTISVLPGEEYVHDGDMINVNQEFNIGFTMSSSIETGKELASFTLVIDDEAFETVELKGTEYKYERTLALNTVDTRDDIDNLVITGTVTDVAGQSASVTITLILNETTQDLAIKTFEWYRLGNTQTGLEEYGLIWEKNEKETHAQIKPMANVTLYKFRSEVWNATQTETEKAALFSDGAQTLDVYNNVSTTVASDAYDDVIGTKMADGTLHLIHVMKCEIGEYQNAGYPITISGESK